MNVPRYHLGSRGHWTVGQPPPAALEDTDGMTQLGFCSAVWQDRRVRQQVKVPGRVTVMTTMGSTGQSKAKTVPRKSKSPQEWTGCLEEAAEKQSGGQGERQQGQDIKTRQQGKYGCPHDLSQPPGVNPIT